jgi:hypothetical protein
MMKNMRKTMRREGNRSTTLLSRMRIPHHLLATALPGITLRPEFHTQQADPGYSDPAVERSESFRTSSKVGKFNPEIADNTT